MMGSKKMKNATSVRLADARPAERGAALISALLISLMLLLAGGALIVTTAMSASNAADATAEAQAYYAAEAGLQSALAVLRGNVASNPAGTPATFRSAVCGMANPCLNSGGDLSLWLPRTNGVVPLDNTLQLSYTVSVTAQELASGAVVLPTYDPRFLTITSTGRGPKGARKVLEMLVDAHSFDFTARAAVAVRSSDTDSTGMVKLDLGSSNPHAWNGNDQAIPPGPPVAAFAVTNTADYDAGDGFGREADGNLQGVAEKAIGADQANVLGPQQLIKMPLSDLEYWLQTANGARTFLNIMQAQASTLGRLNPGDIGTEADPKFTFINGDLSIGGGDHGAGLLIVTGTLTQSGSSSFKGIVIVLGEGKIQRNGTPDALGALIVGKVSRTASTDFEAPYIDSSGGGNSLVGYDSEWVRKALGVMGARVLGVVEK
jgi:hypothetical protein